MNNNETLSARQDRFAGLAVALPDSIKIIFSDFDGVFTDNCVYLSETGTETVKCNRGDGLMIGIFQKKYPNIPIIVISKEKNPVVTKRCEKLKLPCLHGVDHKLSLLTEYIKERGIDMSEVVYLGNDLNDLECVQAVGCGVVVADAYPELYEVADIILHNIGGNNAVRELLELIDFKLNMA